MQKWSNDTLTVKEQKSLFFLSDKKSYQSVCATLTLLVCPKISAELLWGIVAYCRPYSSLASNFTDEWPRNKQTPFAPPAVKVQWTWVEGCWSKVQLSPGRRADPVQLSGRWSSFPGNANYTALHAAGKSHLLTAMHDHGLLASTEGSSMARPTASSMQLLHVRAPLTLTATAAAAVELTTSQSAPPRLQ